MAGGITIVKLKSLLFCSIGCLVGCFIPDEGQNVKTEKQLPPNPFGKNGEWLYPQPKEGEWIPIRSIIGDSFLYMTFAVQRAWPEAVCLDSDSSGNVKTYIFGQSFDKCKSPLNVTTFIVLIDDKVVSIKYLAQAGHL